MNSSSEENYLKAIYKFMHEGNQLAGTGALAELLGVQSASVTDMLRKLSDKGLVQYTKNRGSALTDAGRQAALAIIRKHRLWEVFLVEKLGFGWDEVHQLAEQLEHVKSDILTERLDAFLGNPSFDPHGDPIPDKEGKLPQKETIPLVAASIGQRYKISRLGDTSTEFLQYLDKSGLLIGSFIKMVQQEPFDQSVTIELQSGKTIHLSSQVAELLVVEKME